MHVAMKYMGYLYGPIQKSASQFAQNFEKWGIKEAEPSIISVMFMYMFSF